MKQKFSITGMTCSACSASVEKAVKRLDGVDEANVSLLTNSMEVIFDGQKTDFDKISNAVKNAGYNAEPFSSKPKTTASGANSASEDLKNMKFRLIVSFCFLLPLMYLSMGHMLNFPLPPFVHGIKNAVTFAFLQFLLSVPVVYVNRKYFITGFKTLFKRHPNMDSLIALGSSAAIAYGIFAIFKIGYGLGHNDTETIARYSMDLYFESAATILTLITLGKYFETKSKGKTSEAIKKLLDLAPKTATVERNGIEMEIPVEEVLINDVIIVKPGQRIPVDGTVIEGYSSVDESALTGESIPVEKHAGDKAAASTVNKNGYFKFKAEKIGEDTAYAQIIHLVEEAASSKAPIAKLADKISGIFVPVVISISIISVIIWLLAGKSFEFSLSIGIAVLVISCPCALGLATPVAIMVGTGRGASNGILIKSAEALQTAYSIDTVVLDKTGTITEGKPEVTDIICSEGIDKRELLQLAASIEKPSEHPLAEAILEKAEKENIELFSTENFTALSGMGIEVKINNKIYYAGNHALMERNGINTEMFENTAKMLSENGKTALFFAVKEKLLGIIAVMDKIKPTSKEAVHQFKKMGIDVIMLTGDNKRTAEAVRKELDINKAIAEVFPAGKEAEIRKLQEAGKKVAMIGDGINDAPSLTRADLGIAIGAGTDVAIEAADIVLIRNDLIGAVTAVRLSKATLKNVKQNLFWAFFYNSLGIPLAAGIFYPLTGWKLSPMIAAFAMSLSSVFVVTNALRLRFFKTIQKNKGDTMKKIIEINGMSCGHCSARVEKALNEIEGVEAKVNLKSRSAFVKITGDISDDTLKSAVTNAGYEVVSIKEKKGLFE